MEPCARTIDPPRWAQHGVLLVSIALVWHSLGDHGLFPPDEGRYAAVSGWMATHGNWFEPQLRDQLHITKPPLAYWAQAVAQRAFGQTELAVRLPSALASTALLVATFLFARRCLGAMVATMATGTMAAMPLFAIVSRLAITDPMVAAWWWGAICCSWMVIGPPDAPSGADRPAPDAAPRWPWIAGFWACCALAGLTKGPLALAPPAIVIGWLALARRLRDMRLLAPLIGLPLSLLPLVLVAWGFWRADPARAQAIWEFEFVDRFTGGRHTDPPGLAIPAFILGLFPATAMMTLPFFNLSWRRCRDAMCAGDLRALLVVSVVFPLIGFSLLRGASPTYLLPLAPSMCLLAGLTLARWVGPMAGDVPAGERLPDVRITTGIALTVIGIGLPVAAVVLITRGLAPAWTGAWSLAWMSLVAVPVMLASWACMALWRRPSRRLPCLAAAFVGTAVLWVGLHRIEDVAMGAMSSRPVAEAIRERGRPVAIFGVQDHTIDWYAGIWATAPFWDRELIAWMDANPGASLLITEAELDRLRKSKRLIAARLVVLTTVETWPMRRLVLCEVLAGSR